MEEYQINTEDEANLKQSLPDVNFELAFTFCADIQMNSKKIPRCYIILTQYNLYVMKKNMIGKLFSSICSIFLFKIDSLLVKSKEKCTIIIDDIELIITSSLVPRFAHMLIRNTTVLIPSNIYEEQFCFQNESDIQFSKLNTQLSISQQFQLAYKGFCTMYGFEYSHYVTQFIHNLFITCNTIFDFRLIPSIVFQNLSFRPIFSTFHYFHDITGFIISDVNYPDIISNISSFLFSADPRFRILKIKNCNCESGARELSISIFSNMHLHLDYLNLSGNKLSEFYLVIKSLSSLCHPMIYLNLANCNLDYGATRVLFLSLLRNPNLWTLKYLNLKGAEFDAQGISNLALHLHNMKKAKVFNLEYLNLSKISGPIDVIIQIISNSRLPLKSLKLSDVKLKNCIPHLIHFIEKSTTLEDLDISGSFVKANGVKSIVEAINKNENLHNFSLRIKNLALHGGDIRLVMNEINQTNKFTALYLDDNDIKSTDSEFLIQSLSNMKCISIGSNQINFDNSFLSQLASLPNLEVLRIRSSKPIGQPLNKIIDQLVNHPKLRVLDVRNNKIGNDGLTSICNLLKGNHNIEEICVDGSKSDDPGQINRLFQMIINSPSMKYFKFPYDDIRGIIKKFKDEKMPLVRMFTEQMNIVNSALERNMANAGIHSEFAKSAHGLLDSIIDFGTTQMHQNLSHYAIRTHRAICEAYDCQYPFLPEITNVTVNAVDAVIKAEGADEYEMPELNKIVQERRSLIEDLKYKIILRKKPDFNPSYDEPIDILFMQQKEE